MAITELRRQRIAAISNLREQGLTSKEIGERLHLAPSTVRDYIADPYRNRARKRQRRYSVVGVTMPAGGTPIEGVKTRWKRGGPHQGVGMAHAVTRGKQVRAIIGKRARGR